MKCMWFDRPAESKLLYCVVNRNRYRDTAISALETSR